MNFEHISYAKHRQTPFEFSGYSLYCLERTKMLKYV